MRKKLQKNKKIISCVITLLFVLNFACTGIYADDGTIGADHNNPAPEGYHYVCTDSDGHYDRSQLVCTEAEHSHSGSCFSSTLTCGESESGATTEDVTDEEGNTTTVTVSEGHSHGSGCYDEELVCTETEHSHSDSCYAYVEGTHTCSLVNDGEPSEPSAPAEPPLLDDPNVDEGFTLDGANGLGEAGAIVDEELKAGLLEPIVNEKISLYSEDEDGKETELTNPIDPAAVDKLRFNFTVNLGKLVNDPVHENSIYEVDLAAFSKAFDISEEDNFEILLDSTKEKLGDVTVSGKDGEKKAVITFSKLVDECDYASIDAYFWLSAHLKTENVEDIDWKEIKLPFMGDVDIVWQEPQDWDPEIDKEGSYDAATQTVTWTIKVGPKKINLSGAKVYDTLKEYLEFVPDTARIGEEKIEDTQFIDGQNISYTFNSDVKGEQTISFQTKVDINKLRALKLDAVSNEAKLIWNDKTVSDIVMVTIPTGFITKNGTANGKNEVDWTIVVNENKYSIQNAVVIDELALGMTFVKLTHNGKEIPKKTEAQGKLPCYELQGQTLKIYLSGSEPSTETWKLVLKTKIDEKILKPAYPNFVYAENNAVLNWGPNGTENSQGSTGNQAKFKIIEKNDGTFNPSTHTINWDIVVNQNNWSLKNVKVTDDLDKVKWVNGNGTSSKPDLNLTSLSVVKVKIQNNEKIMKEVPMTNCQGTEKPHYHYEDKKIIFCIGDIENTAKIYFTTDFKVDEKLNANRSVRNWAYLSADGLVNNINDYGDTPVRNMYLGKTFDNYNYATREATWSLDINCARVDWKTPIVEEYLPEGFELTDWELIDAISGKAIKDPIPDYLISAPETLADGKTVVFQFKDFEKGKDYYTLKITTRMTDEGAEKLFGDKAWYNKEVKVTNRAVMGKYEESADTTIKNNVIFKSGEQLKLPDGGFSNQLLWTIDMNHNGGLSQLSGAAITDHLKDGLNLVQNGDGSYAVQAWEMHLTEKGDLKAGRELSAQEMASALNYDQETRILTFKLPDSSQAYRLQLLTKVEKNFSGNISNQAFIEGLQGTVIESSKEINVEKYGSGASGNVAGIITITKVDKENPEKLLSGAAFDLYYGDLFLETQVTGADGIARFTRLYPAQYTIRESKAPEGYVLPNTSWTVTVEPAKGDGAADQTNYTLTIENSVTPEPPTPVPPTPENPGTGGGGGGGNRPTPPDIIINPDLVPGGGIKPEDDVNLGDDPIPGGGIEVVPDTTITDDAVPGGHLPKTGGVPAGLFYGIGAALLFGAGMLRKLEKKNK